MAQITINIDLRNKHAKSFFNYMKTLDFIKVKSDNSTFLNDFEASVIEAEKNKKKKGKSLNVLLNEI